MVKFRTRWNVPHAVEATDWKHIAVKKSKKSGSTITTTRVFLLVLLALVNAEYRFLWVNVGSSGSSSDAQIFNRSDLREKIKDSIFGLLPSEPLGEGGPD